MIWAERWNWTNNQKFRLVSFIYVFFILNYLSYSLSYVIFLIFIIIFGSNPTKLRQEYSRKNSSDT